MGKGRARRSSKQARRQVAEPVAEPQTFAIDPQEVKAFDEEVLQEAQAAGAPAGERQGEMTTAAAEGAGEGELKRLGFVYEYGSKASEVASKAYETAKSQAPASIAPGIETIEGALKAYGAPILDKAYEAAPKVLGVADDRVDAAVKAAMGPVDMAKGAYETYRGIHAENAKVFQQTREEYLKQVEQVLEELKAKGLQGSVKYAYDNLASAVEEVKAYPKSTHFKEMREGLMAKVSELWTKLVENPKVSELVKQSVERAEVAKGKYLAAHGKVVTSPQYSAAYAKGAGYVETIQGSAYYKRAVETATPYVEKAKGYPIVNTCIERAAPIVGMTMEHLKPVPPTA